ELYQRLGMVLYDSADYRRAEEALDTALGLCRIDGNESTEVACVTCLVYVLRERGEWGRSAELGRALMASGTGVWVCEGILGGLAHAIGENAMLEGDSETAAEQLVRAVEIYRGLEVPFERAHVELRAGVALAACGEREPALERLGDAYRTARKLGARPLAAAAAGEVAALGESVSGRLGSRAAAELDGAGLSRRELEVVRLIAVGRTN